jgi:hypothetical protein
MTQTEKTKQHTADEYNFKVTTLACGQPRAYADSIFHFKIIDQSTEPQTEEEVKRFCIDKLRKGCSRSEMPHPFAGEILLFSSTGEREWEYKVRECYTG